MIHSSKENAQYLAQLTEINNIKHIVFSPGSRSAPLVIEYANNPFFDCYTVPDERVAAFMALGLSLQSGEPSVIVCTSGSALLNYYPAIAEAFYQNIPLIVVSADRPSEWIDQADGQTIRQQNVFANHILKSVTLFKDGGDDQSKLYNQRVINEAINTSIEVQGPVHINVPFEEPLYDFADKIDNIRKIDLVKSSKVLDPNQMDHITQTWENATSKLVIVGQLPHDHHIDAFLEILSKDPSVAILTETTSNSTIPETFPCIDRIIDQEDNVLDGLVPEVLLTLGGAIVSKKVKAFLRKHKPPHHWNVTDKNLEPDTFQSLTITIRSNAQDFLQQFNPRVQQFDSTYRQRWTNIHNARKQRHEDFLKDIAFSDLWIFNQINKIVSSEVYLHWANSTAIRYAQLFEYNKAIKHFCNRGTSGIDGSTSTALGFALKSSKSNILVTGDISFFYDSNAYFHRYRPEKFKVLLINNSGGGIFRFIPGPSKTPQLEEVFASSHNFTAKGLAESFQIDYNSAFDVNSFEQNVIPWLKDESQSGVMEVFTSKENNAGLLRDYFKYLKNG